MRGRRTARQLKRDPLGGAPTLRFEMKLLEDDPFLEWAAGHDIAPDPAYHAAAPLIYSASTLACEWRPPAVPSDIEGFLSTLLDAASPKGPYWVYRRGGGSWYEDDTGPLSDQNRNRLVSLVGVPSDFGGALGFERKEWRDLLLLLLAFYIFGWEVGGDIQVIPDDGTCILQTSHHGPVEVRFSTDACVQPFVDHMSKARFPVTKRTT